MRALRSLAALLPLVVALHASHAAAAASFEGVIEMKVTAQQGSGSVVVSVGKLGMRSDMDMQTPQMPMKIAMLVKASEPDTAYAIHDAAKTYSVIDLKAGREAMKRAGGDEALTAKMLGTEKMDGFNCVHALITGKRGEMEVWTSKEILDYAAFQKAMGPNAPANEGMMKALKDAGAEGFIVKMIRRQTGNPEPLMTVELVKAEKKKLDPALFALPVGYAKKEVTKPGAPGIDNLPPEIQAKIREQMEKAGH